MKTGTKVVRETVAGVTFEMRMPTLLSVKHGEAFDGPAMERAALMIAAELGRRGIVTAESFKYARKALGMRAADLAALLDVRAEAISRWENGGDPVPRLAFAAVIAMVRDELAGELHTVNMLRATMEPPVNNGRLVRFEVERTIAARMSPRQSQRADEH